MPSKQERDKQNAIAFYDLMFNLSKPREAVERFVATTTDSTTPSARTAVASGSTWS